MAMRSACLASILVACASMRVMKMSQSRSQAHNKSSQYSGSYVDLMEGLHANVLTEVWPITPEDQLKMKDIEAVLNKGDGKWHWEKSPQGWFFPLTRRVRSDSQAAEANAWAVEALAHHMLHRHGMGPLATSAEQDDFASFVEDMESNDGFRWISRSKKSSDWSFKNAVGGLVEPNVTEADETDGVYKFTQALELFRVGAGLHTMMKGMSLDSLRNIHAFDHQWSVNTHHGENGCYDFSPEQCPLQASSSKATQSFMQKYGFEQNSHESLSDGRMEFFYEFNPLSESAREALLKDKVNRLKWWAHEEADFFRFFD